MGEPVDRGYECCCDGEICGTDDDGVPVVQRFLCAECGCSVPWCWGAADDHPDLCDYCACRRLWLQVAAREEVGRG